MSGLLTFNTNADITFRLELYFKESNIGILQSNVIIHNYDRKMVTKLNCNGADTGILYLIIVVAESILVLDKISQLLNVKLHFIRVETPEYLYEVESIT